MNWASLVAQRLRHLPAMRETWVQPLCREDPLEKELTTHSNILAWRIPWTEKPGGLQSIGSQRVRHNWVTSLSFTFLLVNTGDCFHSPHFLAGFGTLIQKVWFPVSLDIPAFVCLWTSAVNRMNSLLLHGHCLHFCSHSYLPIVRNRLSCFTYFFYCRI